MRVMLQDDKKLTFDLLADSRWRLTKSVAFGFER